MLHRSARLTAQGDALLFLGIAADRIYVDHGLTGTNREHPSRSARHSPPAEPATRWWSPNSTAVTSSGQVAARHEASLSGATRGHKPTSQHLQAALAILTVFSPPLQRVSEAMPRAGRGPARATR